MKECNQYIRRAEHDLKSAKILFQEGIYDVAVYHAQQCGEKILKAYLSSKEEKIIYSHDLSKLNKECLKYSDVFKKYEEYCYILTPYATEFRYVAIDEFMPEKSDVEEAIKIAEIMFEEIKKIIKE